MNHSEEIAIVPGLALLTRGLFADVTHTDLFSEFPKGSMKAQMTYSHGWPARPEPRHQMGRFALPGVAYSYKGKPKPIVAPPPSLNLLMDRVSAVCGIEFNTVVVNTYRDGCGLYPHRDSKYIPELGDRPTIASVSFGEPRTFRLTPLDAKGKKRLEDQSIDTLLGHGDLFVMQGDCDLTHHHSIPEELDRPGLRISLTFRRHM